MEAAVVEDRVEAAAAIVPRRERGLLERDASPPPLAELGPVGRLVEIEAGRVMAGHQQRGDVARLAGADVEHVERAAAGVA